MLADGTYVGSNPNLLDISKNITIRAQNAGKAVLDGESSRRVVKIMDGTILLDGLTITNGSLPQQQVSAHRVSTPQFEPLMVTDTPWSPLWMSG